MALLPAPDGRHAVRAHDQVNRPGRERIAQAPGAERDVEDRRVLDEHRDDNVAARTQIGDATAATRAPASPKRSRLRGDHVEDREFVSGSEDASRHPLAHATEADEAYFHVIL